MQKQVIPVLLFYFISLFAWGGNWVWTKGTWPDNLTGVLKKHQLKPALVNWSINFNDQENAGTPYVVVGQYLDGYLTYASYDQINKRLVVGGGQHWQNAAVIWEFVAPPGKTFQGGTITLNGEAHLNANVPDISKAYLGVSTTLDLSQYKGGGDGYYDYNSSVFSKAYFNSFNSRGNISVSIPANCQSFYVVAAADKTADWNSLQLYVYNLQVNATLDNGYGLSILTERNDPLWVVDDNTDPAEIKVVATGDEALSLNAPAMVDWQLVRQDGTEALRGYNSFNNGVATVDLKMAKPGFYTLKVFDSPEMTNQLDLQDLVILPKQYVPVTSAQSIFGFFGNTEERFIPHMLGAKWTVTCLQWSFLQPNQSTPPDLSGAYEFIKRNNDWGLETIVHIDTAPGWANGGNTPYFPPTVNYLTDWQNYNKLVAEALKGASVWYESWNEINNGYCAPFSSPWDETTQKNVAKQLTQYQYNGLKQGDWRANLIGGCYAGMPAEWVDDLYKTPYNCTNYINAVSGHPYCDAFENDDWVHKEAPEPNLIPKLLNFRNAMNSNGGSAHPLFLTEFGWDVNPGNSTLEQQARWVARQYAIVNAYREALNIKAMTYFTYNTLPHYSIFELSERDYYQHRFRPVINAFATSSAMLAGSSILYRIQDNPNPVRAYQFQRGDELIYACWATETATASTVVLPVSQKITAVRIGMMGEKSFELIQPNTGINLPDNNDPVYLVWTQKSKIDTLHDNLVFHSEQGRTPDPYSMVVANTGSSGPMTVNGSSDQPWVSLASGTFLLATQDGAVELPLIFDTVSLTPGKHTATITLSDINNISPTKKVTISLHVAANNRILLQDGMYGSQKSNLLELKNNTTTIWDKNDDLNMVKNSFFAIASQAAGMVNWLPNATRGDCLQIGSTSSTANASVTHKFTAPAGSYFTGGQIQVQAFTYGGANPPPPIGVYVTSGYSAVNGNFDIAASGTLYGSDTHAPSAEYTWDNWYVNIPVNATEFYVTIYSQSDYAHASIGFIRANNVTTGTKLQDGTYGSIIGNSITFGEGDNRIWDIEKTASQAKASVYSANAQAANMVNWDVNVSRGSCLVLGSTAHWANASVTHKIKAPEGKLFSGGYIKLTGFGYWNPPSIGLYATQNFATINGNFDLNGSGTVYSNDVHAPAAAWVWSEWQVNVPVGVSEFYITVHHVSDYHLSCMGSLMGKNITFTKPVQSAEKGEISGNEIEIQENRVYSLVHNLQTETQAKETMYAVSTESGGKVRWQVEASGTCLNMGSTTSTTASSVTWKLKAPDGKAFKSGRIHMNGYTFFAAANVNLYATSMYSQKSTGEFNLAGAGQLYSSDSHATSDQYQWDNWYVDIPEGVSEFYLTAAVTDDYRCFSMGMLEVVNAVFITPLQDGKFGKTLGNTVTLATGNNTIFNASMNDSEAKSKFYAVTAQDSNTVIWKVYPQGDCIRIGSPNNKTDGAIAVKVKAAEGKKFSGGNVTLSGMSYFRSAAIGLYVSSGYKTTGAGSIDIDNCGVIYDYDSHSTAAQWTWSSWNVDIPLNTSEFYIIINHTEDYAGICLGALVINNVTLSDL